MQNLLDLIYKFMDLCQFTLNLLNYMFLNVVGLEKHINQVWDNFAGTGCSFALQHNYHFGNSGFVVKLVILITVKNTKASVKERKIDILEF